jgi:hypothetical protein
MDPFNYVCDVNKQTKIDRTFVSETSKIESHQLTLLKKWVKYTLSRISR